MNWTGFFRGGTSNDNNVVPNKVSNEVPNEVPNYKYNYTNTEFRNIDVYLLELKIIYIIANIINKEEINKEETDNENNNYDIKPIIKLFEDLFPAENSNV